MQIDCGIGSTLFVTAKKTTGSFLFDTFSISYSNTYSLSCSGLHDLILSNGDGSLIIPLPQAKIAFSTYSSISSLNNTINSIGLSPEAFLFITGILVALAFFSGVRTFRA